MDTQVIIAGGGPVGLTLAISLGQLGMRCILVEKADKPGRYPKMERCNARTMEFFRRLGIVDRVRAAGFPPDASMDVLVSTRLDEPPLYRAHIPTQADREATARRENTGRHPREPAQVISQYTLEPLLKEVAERTPNVTVRFATELVSFAQDEDGVRASIRNPDGTASTLTAAYLVGCDGGSSNVRKQLDIKLEGQGAIARMRQALFRSDELYARIPVKGRHFHMADKWRTAMIVQDDHKHFTIHTSADDPRDISDVFREIVGMAVDFELLYVGDWTQHLLLAQRYRDRRVFIAGDAAHLVIPTGGLGMNTGAGDATDLAWKLAGTLAGWGGPELLNSYEVERRQVGVRNVAKSGASTRARGVWRDAWRPNVRDQTPEGEATRNEIARLADAEMRKNQEAYGVELGYRYRGSPLTVPEGGEPEPDERVYEGSAASGFRLPHVFLEDGRAVHDLIGKGYTLLRFKPTDSSALAVAFAERGAPFAILDLNDAHAREIYGADLLLLRPDLHVVWRGDKLPAKAGDIAAVATGYFASRGSA